MRNLAILTPPWRPPSAEVRVPDHGPIGPVRHPARTPALDRGGAEQRLLDADVLAERVADAEAVAHGAVVLRGERRADREGQLLGGELGEGFLLEGEGAHTASFRSGASAT